MQHGAALARESREPALAEAVASGRLESLEPRLRALCEYALKLTRYPETMREADIAALRVAGLDDRAIVDLNQVVAYYNYVNRIADGLGVELEPDWPPASTRPGRYWSTVPAEQLPWLTVPQMREVDRVAVEEFGLALVQMMENAGRHLAELARRLLGAVTGRTIAVVAGSGGNGGGGIAAARHLANAGANVHIVLASPTETLAPVTRAQYQLAEAMGIHAEPLDALPEVELVLDAVLGYSQAGTPRNEAARLIEWTDGCRVVALDVPSGLELASGTLHLPHVRAEATLTLAAPKAGLRARGAASAVGDLFVADISVPSAVYSRLGIDYRTPFEATPLVRVTGL